MRTLAVPALETGVHIGAVNQRGVTTRDVYDGGQQERALFAARYRQWAKQTAGSWPRTSRVLRGLAESYEREAQREDAQAEITADTEQLSLRRRLRDLSSTMAEYVGGRAASTPLHGRLGSAGRVGDARSRPMT